MNREESAPNNNSAGEVDKSKIVCGFFLKTDQQFAETVEEGMEDLNDPAAGPKMWISLQFLFLLTPGADMSNISPGLYFVLVACIAGIKAKILRLS